MSVSDRKTGQGSQVGPVGAARYLLRLDDLCPTMAHSCWARYFELIEQCGLRPILAVVPDNRDPDLDREPADPGFWPRLQALEAQGAAIALHGLHHLSLSRGGGLLPLHRQTEFAGVEAATQRAWIGEGLRLLRAYGLEPTLWVAPRHGFDRSTLGALADEGVRLLSDGFSTTPYLRNGVVWLPQQIWEPVEKTEGLWTICVHPNTATNAQFERLAGFVRQHVAQFISVRQALEEFPARPYVWADLLVEKKALLRIRLSRLRKALRGRM
jgi:predicted deacetylase